MKFNEAELKETELKTLNLLERRDLLADLEGFVINKETDYNWQKVIESKFYEESREVNFLDAGNLSSIDQYHAKPEKLAPIILLITKIAATLPNLKGLRLNYDYIKEDGLSLANIISSSSSIEEIDMSNNRLTEHAPAIANALTSGHHSKMKIDLSDNSLGGKVAFETAKACFGTHTHFPLTVNLSNNNLHLRGGPECLVKLQELCSNYSSEVAINKEKMFLFFCANEQLQLPTEIICEVAGNLELYPIDFIMDEF